MAHPVHEPGTVLQTVRWGSTTQERHSPADTMFTTAGRRIYVIGDIDGRFRPRSNPYDLYTFGRPSPDDPLAEKLQGVWAQPVKGFNSYRFAIESGGERWALEDAGRFVQSFACVEFDFQRGDLRAERRDFPALDQPLLFSTLTLANGGQRSLDLRVCFTVVFDLQDAWFTSLTASRNTGQAVSIDRGCLVARAAVAPHAWTAAAGGATPPDEILLCGDCAGEMVYALHLEAGQEASLSFGLSIACQAGVPEALETLKRGLVSIDALFAERAASYEEYRCDGPRLTCPDPAFSAAFDLARANLRLLEAETPALGRYFYAGLEMFPFWFSNDGAYSAPGLFAGGLAASALNHIRIGQAYLQAGRVPHQISPSGRLAFAGNAQETPLWVMSIWDAYRWTGDRAFLEALFPSAFVAMFGYVLGEIDPDGDGYPSGPGMVEVEGMGSEKLDSAAYTWSALRVLAEMAGVLGKTAEAEQAGWRAAQIAARFDADWWDPLDCTYAMSLAEPGNTRFPVPHWAVIVPLEVGLAAPERAAQTFAVLRQSYLNRWGLKHTAGEDERVWTLPTATLSRAAYRNGEPQLGFEMLSHVADTLGTGSIGLFHELIPQGACIIQLWSAATFLRGVVEDLLGIEVHTGERWIRVEPQLPAGWKTIRLENLAFGGHSISLEIAPDGIQALHAAGPAPLEIRSGSRAMVLAPGKAGRLWVMPPV